MRLLKPFLIGVLVLTPLIFSVLVPLVPIPLELSDGRETINTASFENNAIMESSALQTVLSYTPWDGEKWLRLGRLQLDLNQYRDSVGSFEKAEVLGQLSTEGKLWMADALIATGEAERAREVLREFSLLMEVDPFVFIQAASFQRSLNDTYGALATLLRGYEIDPHNSEINYQTGLLLSASEPEKALPFLKRALELNTSRKWMCEALIKMIEESIVMMGSAERYLFIGQVLSTYDEWDVAQLAFQKATELNDQNGVAWALLAEAAQQNDQDGQEFITKAQKMAPDEEMVNGLSALYYRRQDKSELALEYLQRALNANPTAFVWEIEIGNTLSEMGDLTRALEHYQAAIKINPQDWAPWRALAAFCVTRNYELEEIGIPAARRALGLNQNSPALLDLLGTALMMNGDLDSALVYFQKADHIDPQQSAILIHLGQLYLAKEDKDKAFQYLRQALEFARDERMQELAKRILQENGGDW